MLGCEGTKAEFGEHIFTNYQFKKVDLGWSFFMDCEFLETKFDDINFEGATIANLKTKNTTFFNLQFHETFPMKFYKSNSIECLEINDYSNFEKLYKAMN